MNDFDVWNKIKQTVAAETEPIHYPDEGDVWMVKFGKNIGYEENGGGKNFSRPVLVIKKFNNQMCWVVPLSRKQKLLNFYYNFKDPHSQDVSIMLAQFKILSVKRFSRKMYRVDRTFLEDVKMRLKLLL